MKNKEIYLPKLDITIDIKYINEIWLKSEWRLYHFNKIISTDYVNLDDDVIIDDLIYFISKCERLSVLNNYIENELINAFYANYIIDQSDGQLIIKPLELKRTRVTHLVN